MIWLYRLQQRLSITRNEGIAVLTLVFLFVTGLTVHHIRDQQVPPVSADSLVAAPVTDTSDPQPTVQTPSPENPIHVNTAPRTALETLPGIGPALSERILQYRSSERPFQQIDELRRVRGIGSKTLADLRPLLTITPPDTTQ